MFTLTANKMRLGTHRDKKCVRCEVLVKIVRMGLFVNSTEIFLAINVMVQFQRDKQSANKFLIERCDKCYNS